MESTMDLANEIIRKEEGLGKEELKYALDPVQDMPQTWKLKHTQIKKTPVEHMDSPPRTPYIARRFAEQHLYISERRLHHKRKEWLLRKQQLKAQWKDLASKETLLKENFIVFSKFLKTNLEKRERAVKKYQSDTETVQKRVEEINILKKKYDIRNNDFQLMRSEILKHSIYKSYLEKVVDEACGEFKDTEDIPKRMEVLLLAKEKMHAKQADQLSFLECSKRVMSQFMESKILQIIGLNNTIASLQCAYDEAISRTMEFDKIVTDLKTTLIKCARDLACNQDSIRGLYSCVCKTHDIPEKKRTKDLISQLMAVNHALKGYRTIFRLLRRKSRRESRIN